MTIHHKNTIHYLQQRAYYLRRWSLIATTHAQSGHITSCLSAADIVAVLFFHTMHFTLDKSDDPANDRFILSKGHAAPLLYAAWKELGLIDEKELMGLRSFNSVLEGHPSRRCRYTEAATGSLGQGLSIGIGYSLYNQRTDSPARTFVLMGDSECSEGSVWEAAAVAAHYNTYNLIAIVDMNRLGQSTETMDDSDIEKMAGKWRAFGWHVAAVNGHDVASLVATCDQLFNGTATNKPIAIIAKTIKGKGLALCEDREHFHGKVFTRQQLPDLLKELEHRYRPSHEEPITTSPSGNTIERCNTTTTQSRPITLPNPPYGLGDLVSPRQAYGEALCTLGRLTNDTVVLDAEVKNSTYTELFEQQFPARFYQCFIAEQNMIGMATGLTTRGVITFSSTFGAFLTRAHDQLRMAAIGTIPLRIMGSHVGISVGPDGPSQMALEDIGMMRSLPDSLILYPADAVSMYRCVELMADYHLGISYVRATREAVPTLYSATTTFTVGGCHIVRKTTTKEPTLCIIAAGITVFEAIKAFTLLTQAGINATIIDCYSVQPLPYNILMQEIQAAGGDVIVVEDHYPAGGIGEAISAQCGNIIHRYSSLAVRCRAHSGTPQELRALAQIDAQAIVKAAYSHHRSAR